MNSCSTPAVCHSRCKHSLHAGLVTRPLYEVRRREETDIEIEFGERHKSGYRKGFSGDIHKYKVLESAVGSY